MNRKFNRGVLSFVILSCLTSCSPDPASKILGKWIPSQGTNVSCRFVKDGTVILDDGGSIDVGKFWFQDKNTMTLQTKESVTSVTISFPSPNEVLLIGTNTSDVRLLRRVSE